MKFLKYTAFPAERVIYSREYVLMTRPEDVSEYDYLKNLKESDEIDFSAFRATSSDISLDFIAYLFPILERKCISSYCDCIDDSVDDIFLKLAYQNNFEKYLDLIDKEDKFSLLDWFLYLIKYEKEKSFVYGNVDEIHCFINCLDKVLKV